MNSCHLIQRKDVMICCIMYVRPNNVKNHSKQLVLRHKCWRWDPILAHTQISKCWSRLWLNNTWCYILCRMFQTNLITKEHIWAPTFHFTQLKYNQELTCMKKCLLSTWEIIQYRKDHQSSTLQCLPLFSISAMSNQEPLQQSSTF